MKIQEQYPNIAYNLGLQEAKEEAVKFFYSDFYRLRFKRRCKECNVPFNEYELEVVQKCIEHHINHCIFTKDMKVDEIIRYAGERSYDSWNMNYIRRLNGICSKELRGYILLLLKEMRDNGWSIGEEVENSKYITNIDRKELLKLLDNIL